MTMSSRDGNLAFAVIMVILLMAGSIGMFVLMQALSSANPDPHEVSHDYSFEGTMGGIACSGTGKSTYYNESPMNPIYVVDYSVSTAEKTITEKFTLLFGEDDRLLPEFYTYIGKQTIGDVETDVWKYSDKGVDYKFYIGGVCVLYLVELKSSELSLIGKIVNA